MICRQDVLDVAEGIGIELTEAEVDEILAQYPVEQDKEPNIGWELIIDNLIYDIDSIKNQYICGCCGIHVPEVFWNEEKDIDQCEDCKD